MKYPNEDKHEKYCVRCKKEIQYRTDSPTVEWSQSYGYCGWKCHELEEKSIDDGFDAP